MGMERTYKVTSYTVTWLEPVLNQGRCSCQATTLPICTTMASVWQLLITYNLQHQIQTLNNFTEVVYASCSDLACSSCCCKRPTCYSITCGCRCRAVEGQRQMIGDSKHLKEGTLKGDARQRGRGRRKIPDSIFILSHEWLVSFSLLQCWVSLWVSGRYYFQ